MREALSGAFWLNLVMMLLAMSISAVPVMAPAIAEDLAVSTKLVGTYTALLWAASVASSIVVGRLVARYGALRVSQLCLVICAAGLIVAGSGPAIFLGFAAVLIGLGQGAETPSSSALLVRITRPADRPLVFSLKQTGGQLGGMLAGFAFPLLLPSLGWRGALLVLVPLVVVLTIALEKPRHRLEPGAAHRRADRSFAFRDALRLVFRGGPLLRLSLVCMAYIAAHVALIAFLVSYLVEECGLSLLQAGALMAISQAGGLFGRVLWGVLSGRVLSAAAILVVIGVGMVLSAGVLGLYGHRLPLPALGLACFCFGATAGGWAGVHIAETARLAPADAVTEVTGAVLVVGAVGLVLGPMAFAALAAVTSFGAAYVAAAFCALAGVLALLVRRAPLRACAAAARDGPAD
jgi:sugar phosphate permease